MYARLALTLLIGLALAGCGSSTSAPSPTATPARQLAFSRPPKMTIDPNHDYRATVVTDDGTFVIRLLPKVAPITVNNFVFLANHRYYDGQLIFRVIKGFMFQTGDPTALGSGGPGYTIPDEKVTLPYNFGAVAMAKRPQKNSGGSQFFVVIGQGVNLPSTYTIFGQVISGFKVLLKIGNTPVQQNPGSGELSQPINDLTVHSITVR
jgi:cyclophilin family peptidyl-prolyl cis-trans isomerase